MSFIYQRSIFSDLEDVKIAMQDVINKLRNIINDEDLIFDIRLILNELVINSAIHGNKCNRDKSVELYLELKGNVLKIKIMDEGQGIDYDIKSYNPEELKCCGRGLVIVNGLSDEFHIEKNKVEVVKYIC
ncbi:MAG: ATP-binding protein [Tissierellia bacterium]|nr:ATP-binding protein [Tissierellia bacterium]